tara:strand:- start:1285 stop:2532 length:1248 start_codon:yes stop_codon:yes gene_type:complete
MATNLRQNTWGLDENYAEVEAGNIGYYDEGEAFEMWAWGKNEAGSLGQNNLTKYSSPVQIPGSWSKNYDCAGAPASQPHILAVKTDSTLWTWGMAENGGLGLNQGGQLRRSSPVQIPGTWSTTRGTLAAGPYSNNFAIKTNGTLWAWGHNSYGTLGLNDRTHRSSPTQIPGTSWKQVTSGKVEDVQAIRTDGTMWSWGMGSYAGLNIPGNISKSSPTQIPGTDWASVHADNDGNVHLATRTDGTLWYWGEYQSGASGQGVPSNKFTQLFGSNVSSPIQIPGTDWSTDVNSISCFEHGVAAVKTDGTLWTWGNNSRGRLGHSDKYAQGYDKPTQVGTDNNWATVNMGHYYASATKTDGTIWVWGGLVQGVGGSNYEDDWAYSRSSPTQVAGSGFGWQLMQNGCQSSIRALKSSNAL